MSKRYRFMKSALLPFSMLVILEFVTRTALAGSETWVPPTHALAALGRMLGQFDFWQKTGFTLSSAAIGLSLAMVSGVVFGILIGLSARAAQISFLSIEVLRPLPSIALAPLALIVFGFGMSMEVSIVAFACFWPILVLTQSAVQQVEPRLIEVSDVLGFNTWERSSKIIFPAIVPRLFVALRLGVAVALVVAVTVEIAINPNGMGYGLITAQQSLDPASMMAWLVWIGAVGFAINWLAMMVQRRVDYNVGAAS